MNWKKKWIVSNLFRVLVVREELVSGGSRTSQTAGANPKDGGTKLLFSKVFPENWGAGFPVDPPPPTRSTNRSISLFQYKKENNKISLMSPIFPMTDLSEGQIIYRVFRIFKSVRMRYNCFKCWVHCMSQFDWLISVRIYNKTCQVWIECRQWWCTSL